MKNEHVLPVQVYKSKGSMYVHVFVCVCVQHQVLLRPTSHFSSPSHSQITTTDKTGSIGQ